MMHTISHFAKNLLIMADVYGILIDGEKIHANESKHGC